ncbi:MULTISPECIES: hypothetical protein [unclassified Mesorhizobium]|uniref:hypothetical protein n=1 Tax=unclassified Mesorhizobium TaxID=325217 RepID=UPI0015E27A43|nr:MULTISPECIES: hypothetical protein [unclassified Mesorhizobium]
MRLQQILQDRLGRVIAVGMAHARLGRIQVRVSARAAALALVAKPTDLAEGAKQIGRDRTASHSDEGTERRVIAVAAAIAAGTGRQELLGVLETKRAGRDIGLVAAAVSVALTTGRVALTLMGAVVAIVVVAGIARRWLLAIAVPVVAVLATVVAGSTARAGRSGRSCRTGRTRCAGSAGGTR